MKLLNQEYALKALVPLKSAKRGLKLCDLIREGLVAYATEEGEEKLASLEALWAEFCGIALEGTPPPIDALDFHEVLNCLQGFTTARSRTSA